MDVETVAAGKPSRPRRLRLDELLRELGADDGESRPSEFAVADAELAASRGEYVPPEPCNVCETPAKGSARIPRAIAERGASVTVGELVDKAAEAGFGFTIGVLALIAIPFFGLSTPFGLAIALLGVQLAIGKHRPWLPARLRRRQLSMTMLDRVLRLFTKRLHWLVHSTRRRWEGFLAPRLIGLGITLLGLGLALPLPIPGSNMIFIVPIMIYAIALLEGDGVWSALGHLGTIVDMVLLIVFGATVVTVLQGVWHWIT
jgi:hypothetical protein